MESCSFESCYFYFSGKCYFQFFGNTDVFRIIELKRLGFSFPDFEIEE